MFHVWIEDKIAPDGLKQVIRSHLDLIHLSSLSVPWHQHYATHRDTLMTLKWIVAIVVV